MPYVKPRYGAGSSWYSIRVSREAFYIVQQKAMAEGVTVRDLINQWLGITAETPVVPDLARTTKRRRPWGPERACVRCTHKYKCHPDGEACEVEGCVCPQFKQPGLPAHKQPLMKKGEVYERVERTAEEIASAQRLRARGRAVSDSGSESRPERPSPREPVRDPV